jgi:hypothetical protein
MKEKLRKLARKVRNVFNDETEKELSALAIEYFEQHDKIDDLEDEISKMLLKAIEPETPLRSRERYC